MKIIFLCGCLEPGHDGVGDYSRRLAKSLTAVGHSVWLFALNDRYVDNLVNEKQIEDEVALPVIRLPFSWQVKKKLNYARNWIDIINPDWLSLQYVIFAFHDRGLPIGFHRELQHLGKGYNWHIMFHELWVGMGRSETIKLKVWGAVQKSLIRKLIKDLRPKVIHTQCDLYFEQLKREKYQVKKLPLFSNIEVFNSNVTSNLGLKYLSLGSPSVKFIFFGGLHPQEKLGELVLELKALERTHNTEFEFLYIGRNGRELSNHLKILDKENVKYTVFGELDPIDISYLLSVSTFGISTGSPQFLEKNGTVATMIAHRLPIICIGINTLFSVIPEIKMLKGIYFLEDLVQLLYQRPVIEPSNTLPDIANKYVLDLQLSGV